MKTRKMSFSAQYMFIICALLLLFNVALGSVLLARSKMLIKTLINERMLDISNTAADMLDGDILEGLTEESVGTPGFQLCFDTLKSFQDNINLEYIYAVRDMRDGSFTFVVDPAEEDPGEYGQPIKVTDALLRAATGTPAVDDEPYEDAWGMFYTSYSPVFDTNGDIAGIVCVDFRADWYERQLSNYSHTVLFFSVFSLTIGALVVFIINSRMRGRLRTLNSEVSELTDDMDELLQEIRIGAEDAEAPVEDGKSHDEINELGKRIHSVRGALRRYIDYTHSRANSMITALASDYRSVYYVDLDANEGVCYRALAQIDDGVAEGERFSFRESFADYAKRYVAESDREEFLRMMSPERIRSELEQESVIAHRYLIVRNGQESYEMARIASVKRPNERDGGAIREISVGFADVDRETRESLAQRQALQDALAAAEDANRAKTAFLSSMSHEIRTPMNAIIGLDSIALNDAGLAPKTREYLEKIGVSARHLLGLINDILDMSRIESGRVTLKREEFSFHALLNQINAIIDSQCRDKGLSYDCQIKGELSDYYIGDDMKIKQVIINILGNAVKFTPKGGRVTLLVECVARYQRQSALRFTVSDTGIGIDKAFLPKLFEPFSQEDSSTTNKYGSAGLGMAITKNIVEMMNGKIEVESEKGVGTTFTVTITLMGSDRRATGEDDDFHPHGLNTLVIDDDPIACEHAKLTLEKAGVTAETALSGEEALEMLKLRHARREAYNFILVDWKMPEMDGLETTRQIRGILGGEPAIIILTAYNWDEVFHEAISAGVDSFISKPLSVSNVLNEFRSALKKEAETERPRKADLSGRRILLAEDIEINAEIMTEALQMRGMEVDCAENGKIAVEMFASSPENWYDAILMDMRMPEMDGLQAAATIRAMDRPDAKTIPVIALTANAFDEDVQRSLQAGLNAHLSKPVEPESLFSTLESFMSRR